LDKSDPAVETPNTAWSLIPTDEIAAMPQDAMYGLLKRLIDEYHIKPPHGYDLMPPEDVRDWLIEACQSDKIQEAYERAEAEKVRRAEEERKRLPVILTNDRRLREMTDDAIDALQRANEDNPSIFIRGGTMVRVGKDEHGSPIVSEANEAATRGALERCANWARFVNRSGKFTEIPVPPPLDVVRDFRGRPPAEWGLYPLVGITETPIIHDDGSIHALEGYDPESGLYYSPLQEFVMPEIPETPTPEDLQQARALIEEVTEDFPYEKDADRANAIAAMITPIIRSLIDGAVPMVLFDKPSPGSGGSLLAEVNEAIATGRPAQAIPPPSKDEEMRKTITSELMKARPVATIDNIEGKLEFPSLAAALTAKVWRDRVLGRSEMMSLPCRVAWQCTGNNVMLAGDLPRRCYRVRIDAQVERPWLRTGPAQGRKFLHDPLIPWVLVERSRIVAAILTLTRAWLHAGRPAPSVAPLGTYEEWTRIVGGILQHAGIAGFLENLADQYAESDLDTPEWGTFLTTWHDIFGEMQVSGNEIMLRLLKEESGEEDNALILTLPDDLAGIWATKDKRVGFTRSLGWALKHKNGTRYGCGLMIKSAGTSKRATLWKVVKIGSGQTTLSPSKDAGVVGSVVSHGELVSFGECVVPGEEPFSEECIHYTSTEPLQQTHSNSSTHPTEIAEASAIVPIPSGSLKHPIEAYSPRKFDAWSLCTVRGCGSHAEYGAGAGFGLCSGHYQAALQEAAERRAKEARGGAP